MKKEHRCIGKKNRRWKKADAIVKEETQEDLRAPRTWRLVPVPPEIALEDALAGRECRIAAIARGPNPATLDSAEMHLAEEIGKRAVIRRWYDRKSGRRNLATFILGRVPHDFRARVWYTQETLASSPGRLYTDEREGW